MQSKTAVYCAALAVAALASAASAQTVTDPSFNVTPFATGLSQPTGIAFEGSNLWAIEKATGRVKRRGTGSSTFSTVLDLPVNSSSERGLIGIELHPDFATNGYVYLHHSVSSTGSDTTASGSWTGNVVERYTFDGTSLTSPLNIFSVPSSTSLPNGPNHDGGVLRFGPDGKLYGQTGDLNRNGREQNYPVASAGVGGIFRLNDDGTTPSDNPFITDSDTTIQKWYAYGVRNGFGMAFDPQTGSLWDTENGPSSYDEINKVDAGFNSGWEDVMGPIARDASTLADLVNLAPGGTSTYSDPKYSWLSPVAVTSMEFFTGPRFVLDYNDAVIAGDSNNGQLYLFRLNSARDGFVLTGTLADLVADSIAERNLNRFGTGWNVVTDLQIGPDGALYALSLGNGSVYRLSMPIVVDFNDDDKVDVADLGILAANFRSTVTNGRLDGDANRDGVVDVSDLGLLASYFRFNTGTSALSMAEFNTLSAAFGLPAVPEPATLAALAASGLLLRRRR